MLLEGKVTENTQQVAFWIDPRTWELFKAIAGDRGASERLRIITRREVELVLEGVGQPRLSASALATGEGET